MESSTSAARGLSWYTPTSKMHRPCFNTALGSISQLSCSMHRPIPQSLRAHSSITWHMCMRKEHWRSHRTLPAASSAQSSPCLPSAGRLSLSTPAMEAFHPLPPMQLSRRQGHQPVSFRRNLHCQPCPAVQQRPIRPAAALPATPAQSARCGMTQTLAPACPLWTLARWLLWKLMWQLSWGLM